MGPRHSLVLVSALALLLATVAPAPAGAGSQPVARVAPGKSGNTVVLADSADVKSFDAVVDAAGTTFLGWIAAPSGNAAARTVNLCRVPSGGSACAGGVQTISPGTGGGSSAHGLRVLDVDGTITLLWFHDTPGGPTAAISRATVSAGGVLGSGTDVAQAPSFGGMYDATVAPNGSVWAVTWAETGGQIQIHPGLGNSPVVLDPAWNVGQARIAFDGTQGVIVLDELGGFSKPIKVTSQRNDGTWRAIADVPRNWSLQGSWDLVRGADGKVRVVTSVANADYHPQIATWRGTDFGAFRRTGYRGACQFTTHDLYADASGRLADAFHACDAVRIFNHPAATTSAGALFRDTRTPVANNAFSANGPQIATSPRGTGWLMWTVLGDGGHRLLASPIRLPGKPRPVSTRAPAGRVTLRGPVSCLPASDFKAKVTAKASRGWSVVSKQLRLDGTAHPARIDGDALVADSRHVLEGRAVFRKGGQRRTVNAKLTFRACPDPSAF